jgi:hypothetical protein
VRVLAVGASLAVSALALFGCAHPQPPPAAPPTERVAPAPLPDDTSEMQISGALGSLSDDEVNGPFQRHWDEITRCYDDARARLPYLGGKLEIKVRVGAGGVVKKAFISSSTMGNYEAERCILTVARGLEFSRPHGGPEAEFTYPIEFRARGNLQTWDPARLSPSIGRHRQDVASCRQRAPSAPGLMLTVYVAPGGKVASAGLAGDAPLDEKFASCLVDKTRTWRLDDPLGRIAKATAAVGD